MSLPITFPKKDCPCPSVYLNCSRATIQHYRIFTRLNMTGQGAPDYGDEYVDIDIYGRGWDIVHGPGAYEAGKRECLDRLIETRNRKAGIEPGEEWQIDPDVYGRAHPTIFGPNSHLRNAEEAAATMRARQENREPRPNCVMIPVRAIWKAMKKGSKTISRESSKLWNKAKSVVTKSEQIPSDNSRASNSPDSPAEALPVQLEDQEEIPPIEIPEDDGPMPTRTPDEVDPPKHNFQFRTIRDPTHESGFRGVFVDVNKPGYVDDSAIPTADESEDEIVPNIVTASSSRRIIVTGATAGIDHSVRFTTCRHSADTEDPTERETAAPVDAVTESHERRKVSVREIALKYDESTTQACGPSEVLAELCKTEPDEKVASISQLAEEEIVHASSNGSSPLEQASSHHDSSGTIPGAIRVLSKNDSSQRSTESKAEVVENDGNRAPFVSSDRGMSQHTNDTGSVQQTPSLPADLSTQNSSEPALHDLFASSSEDCSLSSQGGLMQAVQLELGSASHHGSAACSQSQSCELRDKPVSIADRILMFGGGPDEDGPNGSVQVEDESQSSSVRLVNIKPETGGTGFEAEDSGSGSSVRGPERVFDSIRRFFERSTSGTSNSSSNQRQQSSSDAALAELSRTGFSQSGGNRFEISVSDSRAPSLGDGPARSKSDSNLIEHSRTCSETGNAGAAFEDTLPSASMGASSIEASKSQSESHTEPSSSDSDSDSSSETSSGSSSDEYTWGDMQSEDREAILIEKAPIQPARSSSKQSESYLDTSEEEEESSDSDDDIASSYIPRRQLSRKSGSLEQPNRTLHRVAEDEADDILPKYLSRRQTSQEVLSKNGSSTARNSESGSTLESQSSLDLEETMNHSRRSSGSARRFSFHSPAKSHASSDRDNSDGGKNQQEQVMGVSTEEKASEFELRPTSLAIDDIPNDEPVAVVRTPTMDWDAFPNTSDDDSSLPDTQTQAKSIKKKKSWWSGWTKSSKKSSSRSSEASSEGETFRFAKQRSGETMLKSLQNALSGESRFGYQAPISFAVKTKRSDSRDSEYDVSNDAVIPTGAARSYAELCKATRKQGVDSANSAPVTSVSTYNSTFSPAVRTGGTTDGILPPEAPSTRQVTSTSNTGSYHTAKSGYSSAISPLAPATIKSTNTYNSTFTIGGPSSRPGNTGDNLESDTIQIENDSTDGSSDFGEFVYAKEVPDSAKNETYNSAFTEAENSMNDDKCNYTASYESMFSTPTTAAKEATTKGMSRSVRFAENTSMMLSPQRVESTEFRTDSTIPQVSVQSMNTFLDTQKSEQTSPVPAASVRSMGDFLDPHHAGHVSIRSLDTFTSPVSPHAPGTTSEIADSYNSVFTTATEKTVPEIRNVSDGENIRNRTVLTGPVSSVSPIAPTTVGSPFESLRENPTGSSEWFVASVTKVDTAGKSFKSTKSVKFADIEGASEMGSGPSGLSASGRANSDLPWMKEAKRKLAASKALRKNSTYSPRAKGRLHSTDESNQGNESNSPDDQLANTVEEHVEEVLEIDE